MNSYPTSANGIIVLVNSQPQLLLLKSKFFPLFSKFIYDADISVRSIRSDSLKSAKNLWHAVHPVSWMKEGAREKLFVKKPGSISCKAVFIVENYVKRCWLTTGFKVIDLCKLNREQFLKVSLAGDRTRGSSRLKIDWVETKVSSEPMNFSNLMGKINFWLLHGWPRMERERETDLQT